MINFRHFRFMLVMAAGFLVASMGSAQAGDCGYATCWGAVGIGSNGAFGFSHSYPSEAAAMSRVQAECAGNCEQIQSFYNTCGAMARGNGGAWGFGWADTRAQAEANALGYCQQNGSGCRGVVWACSP